MLNWDKKSSKLTTACFNNKRYKSKFDNENSVSQFTIALAFHTSPIHNNNYLLLTSLSCLVFLVQNFLKPSYLKTRSISINNRQRIWKQFSDAWLDVCLTVCPNPDTQFTCHSSQCIPQHQFCDAWLDVCLTVCPNPDTQFTCHISQCIPQHQFCDGLVDCTDDSDDLAVPEAARPTNISAGVTYDNSLSL
ncbi:hypothetical protein Pmani_025168 [Petrolisthes manimaculis]|uniref:Uncharacterized protein n=1 Tax=Petrolisthes manimaculis TaxID=1843537 RepID=A0AAE1P8I0_9EUCA|nr:hypothetical protein Pmani_025168 [Petrolisthes manimaculis]